MAFTATETGGPTRTSMGQPSGAVYARSFSFKMMTLAKPGLRDDGRRLVRRLSDGGDAQNPYSFIGSIRTSPTSHARIRRCRPTMAMRTGTLGGLLKGASTTAPRRARSCSPRRPRGVVQALRTASGRSSHGRPRRAGDRRSAAVHALERGAMSAYAWDYSKTKASSTLRPSGGKKALMLTSSPRCDRAIARVSPMSRSTAGPAAFCARGQRRSASWCCRKIS